MSALEIMPQPGLVPGDVSVRFADEALKNPLPSQTSAALARTMVSGACVLCACVSARRWYVVDEETHEAEAEAGSSGTPAQSPSLTYLAGLGTSRERRLPLVLAPRSLWSGAGANAETNNAQLCPHCHIQNEQLWSESGVSDGVSNLASVRDTMRNFDRIMTLLAPKSNARRTLGRPRRRSQKHGGVSVMPVRDDQHVNESSMLSKSAPSLRVSCMDRVSAIHHPQSNKSLCDESLRRELVEADKMGVRRRRRWANDRLLRELGGAMTVSEMQQQFMPPPFGAPPEPTAFEKMLNAQARGEWSGFHKVDMDKERTFLQSLTLAEQQKRQQRATSCGFGVGNEAQMKWSGVSTRARAALRSVARRSPERLERLEQGLLDFAESSADVVDDGANATLVLPLSDPFARLLAHGLCEFHGFGKTSRVSATGVKELVVRPVSVAVSYEHSVRDEDTTGMDEATGDDETTQGDSPPEVSQPWRPPAVTCVAFLKDLEKNNGSATQGIVA